MSYNVIITAHFAKETKTIAKKHPGIKSDIDDLITQLESKPTLGVDLGQNF